MENAGRIVAACLSGLFFAIGAFLAFRQWQAGEEVTVLLPCLLGGAGLGFLALAFFYPFSPAAESCVATTQANDDSDSESNGLEAVDSSSRESTS
jgi:hypothetical protein